METTMNRYSECPECGGMLQRVIKSIQDYNKDTDSWSKPDEFESYFCCFNCDWEE